MLTQDLLSRQPWLLSAGHGAILAPALRFISDGLTWGSPSLLEARWRCDDGVLVLSALDGSETARLAPAGHGPDGQPVLAGPFLRPAPAPLTYHLRPARGAQPIQQSGRLHSAVTLGGDKKILFVSFASLKRGFLENQARWEFFSLPLSLGLDHVRLAESWSPEFMWYVDKTATIRSLLNGILPGHYDIVVMCGISSGGYASLLFGELLAQDHPQVQFRSFTINAQTTHSAAARAYMRTLLPDYIPALINDTALALADIAETDIAAIARLSPSRQNIQHHLFYDGGNPAENYYVGQVAGLAGVHLHPVNFAVGHLSGCIALFERQLVHDAVTQLVEDAARPS